MKYNVPDQLRYTATHEWIRQNPDGTVTIGITDYAQRALGDLVFVEPPTAGKVIAVGECCAVVESVKSASDVYCPLSGTITAGNASLSEIPEQVNSDPYGAGWLLEIRPADPDAIDALLDARAYVDLIAETSPST